MPTALLVAAELLVAAKSCAGRTTRPRARWTLERTSAMRKMMISGLFAAFLSGCATSGGRPATATKYLPQGPLGGYSEKEIEPGIWQVTGRANGIAPRGFGSNMALYRAAEILYAKGFTHVQVIDQKGSSISVGAGGSSGSYGGETLVVTVRGANDPARPADCRAKNPAACMTIDAAEVMARLAPALYIAPAAAR